MCLVAAGDITAVSDLILAKYKVLCKIITRFYLRQWFREQGIYYGEIDIIEGNLLIIIQNSSKIEVEEITKQINLFLDYNIKEILLQDVYKRQPYNLQIFRIAKFLFENKNVKNIHFSEVVSDQKDMLFTEKDIDELLIEYEKIADLIIRKIKKKEYVGCYPLTTFMEKIHNNIPTIRPCSVCLLYTSRCV